jgi:phosphate-selective porin OprO/OprP
MKRPQSWRFPVGSLLIAGGCFLHGSTTATAQAPLPALPSPSPSPVNPDTNPASTPVSPPAVSVPEAPTAREAMLEDRINKLESIIKQMQTAGVPGTTTPAVTPLPPAQNFPRATGGIAPGQGTPPVPLASDKDAMPAKVPNKTLKGRFGPGFDFRTEDEEFVLEVHNVTQVEFRGYQQGGQQPVKDTFDIPREWLMFSGRLTKPFEYFVSFQSAFDTVLGLDIFGNVHYDDRFQFKFGRYKTPFTYEFYSLPIQGLIQPERSLFFNNFALNREIGATLWGQLFEKKVDYAVSILNEARNGFLDTNDGKAFTAFANWRPFLDQEDTMFQYLNVGGSVLTSDGVGVVAPLNLRTNIATSGNLIIGEEFLRFNSNAREAGLRTFWDLHLAWYHKQLSVIAEWQSGGSQYALANNLDQRTRVPIDSFYVQAGYFLTGETVTGRGVVNPIKPFDPRPDHFGIGAVELTGRYNYLGIGPQVFTAGLSDPNLWTRTVNMTDLGFNWYWTQNIKWYFDWQHAEFGQPVVFAPGRLQKNSDTFMARFQIFF